jgi:hypothetical protein
MGNTRIYITIKDPVSMRLILKEGIEKGLIKNLTPEDVTKLMSIKSWPVQIPVEFSDIMNLIGSSVVKTVFGSKVDKAVSGCLKKVIEAG